jgi:hypothetical protein
MYYFINQASCITIAVVLTFLATVVVLLRLIQTGKNRDSYKPGAVRSVFRTWHLDDLYAILALVCVIKPDMLFRNSTDVDFADTMLSIFHSIHLGSGKQCNGRSFQSCRH